MTLLEAPLAALAWIGRQGTRAVAALVVIGLALPSVGAVLRPHVSAAIFVLLAIAFLRVDTAVLRSQLKRPAVVLLAIAWSVLAVPALTGVLCLVAGIDRSAPGLFVGLMLQAMASPMMSAPAFAALMGLDATLVVVVMVAGTALTTVSAPLFAAVFVGAALPLSPLALGLRLLVILAGALAVAVVLRRAAGVVAIRRWKDPLDGFNVVILYVFVAAVMTNVPAQVAADPLAMAGLAALAFAVVLTVLGLTAMVFLPAGPARAFALGLAASQRNMGLMLAATSRDLPEQVWVYFALCQLPIYLLPALLKPLAAMLTRAREAA